MLLLLFSLVSNKLALLLLHTTMVDLLEVSLLAQFVVGGASFLSNDSSLIELLLEDGELVRQSSVLPVDLGDLWQDVWELSIGSQLGPLLLEDLQSVSHMKLNEEVADKFI